MEFKRAYGDEAVDKGLLEHHLRVITPLLEARHRFAGVRHFRLFDWQRSDGSVDENVFAYSNQSSTDGSSSLIIYNNAYETTMGTLHWSAPVPGSDGGLESEELLSAFSCPEDRFCALYAPRRDAWLISEQAHLREQGLTLELKGYEVQVFDRVETFSTLSSVLLDQLRTTGQLWVDGSGFQQLSNPAVGLEQSACA